VVKQDSQTGLLSISYTEILPVLIEAFKEFVSDYKDNQQDIRQELSQFQSQLISFSRQLSEARATEQESQNIMMNLTTTSRYLFRPTYLQPVHTTTGDQNTERPISQIEVVDEGEENLKSNKIWNATYTRGIFQAILFITFLGALACSIVGAYYLVMTGTTVPTTLNAVGSADPDDDDRSQTMNPPIDDSQELNTEGILLAVIGGAGMVASCIGFICVLANKPNKPNKRN